MQQHIDLPARERREFPASLTQHIRDLAAGKKPSGACAEVSKGIEATSDVSCGPNQFFVQLGDLRTSRELSEKGLSASVQSAGGYLVGTEVSQQIEAALRPASTVIAAGARVVQLYGNMAVRREMSAPVGQWLAETDQVSEQNSAFGQLTLTAHRFSVFSTLTKQLQNQVTPDVSDYVVSSLAASCGVGLDVGALTGPGIFGAPTGLYSTAGVNSILFSGAATWATLLKYESQIVQANGADRNISFIGSPQAREKLRSVARFANGSDTLWDPDDDAIGTHPAFVTTSMPATGLVAGDFSKMLIGIWNAAQVTVDPYLNKRSEKIEIVVTMMADVGVVWPQVFAINSGSVTQ